MKRNSVTRANRFGEVIVLIGVLSSAYSRAQVSVTTWHNDIGRTGQNTAETTLSTSKVNKTTFGKVCSATVDGQVYAQPLTMWDATNARNVVFVVTQNDSVYAFDGRNCSSVGSNTALLPTGEYPADCHWIDGKQCQTISPRVGILGTPVIDSTTNTFYLVTESQNVAPPNQPTAWYHRIHALDLTIGSTFLQEKATYNSAPNGQVISGQIASTGLQFASQSHIQRPGLLWLSTSQSGLANNVVYIAFSMMDGDSSNPNGWIFGYNAQNLASAPLVYATTPGTRAQRGGIWQSGGGIAAGLDGVFSTNFLYFTTGDGTFDGATNFANSFIKLTPSLTRAARRPVCQIGVITSRRPTRIGGNAKIWTMALEA